MNGTRECKHGGDWLVRYNVDIGAVFKTDGLDNPPILWREIGQQRYSTFGRRNLFLCYFLTENVQVLNVKVMFRFCSHLELFALTSFRGR